MSVVAANVDKLQKMPVRRTALDALDDDDDDERRTVADADADADAENEEVKEEEGEEKVEVCCDEHKEARCALGVKCIVDDNSSETPLLAPAVQCAECTLPYHAECMGWAPEQQVFARRVDWRCPQCRCCSFCQERDGAVAGQATAQCVRCDLSFHVPDCLSREIRETLDFSSKQVRFKCQECLSIPAPEALPPWKRQTPNAAASPLYIQQQQQQVEIESQIQLDQGQTRERKIEVEGYTNDDVEVEEEEEQEGDEGDENRKKGEVQGEAEKTVRYFGGLLGPDEADTKNLRPTLSDYLFFRARYHSLEHQRTLEHNKSHAQETAAPRDGAKNGVADHVAVLADGTHTLDAEKSATPGQETTTAPPSNGAENKMQTRSQRSSKAPPAAGGLAKKDQGGGERHNPSFEESPNCVRWVVIGDHEVETWYPAPYPEEYARLPVIFVCEFCLRYMPSRFVWRRHLQKCVYRFPPGTEIHRENALSVFEVDGNHAKMYCQSLCLLSKMFLDHKTLYYDVEPFLFYVLTRRTERGFEFAGYFSKEKRSVFGYNLSCIMTLPPYQRHGYGQYMIRFSYLMSRREQRSGTPEKPLSDLGAMAYRSVWRKLVFSALARLLGGLQQGRDAKEAPPSPAAAAATLSIHQLTVETGMTHDDVITTLERYGFLCGAKAAEIASASGAAEGSGGSRRRTHSRGDSHNDRASTPNHGSSGSSNSSSSSARADKAAKKKMMGGPGGGVVQRGPYRLEINVDVLRAFLLVDGARTEPVPTDAGFLVPPPPPPPPILAQFPFPQHQQHQQQHQQQSLAAATAAAAAPPRRR